MVLNHLLCTPSTCVTNWETDVGFLHDKQKLQWKRSRDAFENKQLMLQFNEGIPLIFKYSEKSYNTKRHTLFNIFTNGYFTVRI